jgi:hypothetical protein
VSPAAAEQSAETTPEHPPFPIPGVPMSCPDEENGVCWCGGPNQQFPCEPCRLKRDANNLDLKAVAEPKLRVPQLRVPHSGARRRSARQGGIAKNLPSRSSEPCTLYPAPCTLFPGPCCRVCNDFEESHSKQDKNCHPKKSDSFTPKAFLPGAAAPTQPPFCNLQPVTCLTGCSLRPRETRYVWCGGERGRYPGSRVAALLLLCRSRGTRRIVIA